MTKKSMPQKKKKYSILFLFPLNIDWKKASVDVHSTRK